MLSLYIIENIVPNVFFLFCRGRELQRRLADRVREADLDLKDRTKEQEELDELKSKIFSGEYDNPTLEYERLKRERDDMYKPKILIDVNLELSQQREKELERERERDIERQKAKERERLHKERYVLAQANRDLASIDAEPIDSDSSGGHGHGHDILHDADNDGYSPKNNHMDRLSSHRSSESRDSTSLNNNINNNNMNNLNHDEDSHHSIRSNNTSNNSPVTNSVSHQQSATTSIISLNLNANAKKKKLEVKDVFNMDDENEETNGPKKRKLIPLGNWKL